MSASERSHDAPSAEGHTLAEIREIAGQVGIDAARVDRAAAALERPLTTNAFLGFPMTFQTDLAFPFRLSSDSMRGIAQEAERVLGGAGSVNQTADSLEWYSSRRRAFVGVVRGSNESRVRIITDHAHEFIIGAGGLGAAGIIGAFSAVSGVAPPGGFVLAAGIIAGTWGAGRLYWSWRSRTAASLMSQLLDSLHGTPDETG